MSNLSQFFSTSTGATAEFKNNSVMQVISETSCVTVPSAATYISYSALGAGGVGCSVCSESPSPQGPLFSFCGAGGGGGGFAYSECDINPAGELTLCAVIGAGGTGPGAGQGGCSCVQDISPVPSLNCIFGLGGTVCIDGTAGGSAGGGIINTCGGSSVGYSTSGNILQPNPVRTYPPYAKGYLMTSDWYCQCQPQIPCNDARCGFFCDGGAGAGNIFGDGINSMGPCAGGMGPSGGSATHSPALAGKNGELSTTHCHFITQNPVNPNPSRCYLLIDGGSNHDIERPEVQFYAQQTATGRFSQNKTLFSASGGAGLPTYCGITLINPTLSTDPQGGGRFFGSAYDYCVPGAAGGQGGMRGKGGFGGGGGEIGGKGGCGGGGGTAAHSRAIASPCPVGGSVAYVCNGEGGNGVAVIEYWLDE